MDRKEYMKTYHKKWRAKKSEDPEWVEKEKARQRDQKRSELEDPERGDRRRVIQKQRHHERYETDLEYKEKKLLQAREKYDRDGTDGVRRVSLRHSCKKYGITIERFEEMLEEQNGLCAICGREETRVSNGVVCRLAIDHDHKTGKVRALLCAACNTAIGRLDDRIELLEKAIEYLRKYNGT